MDELFKTVLTLSILGFALIAVLLVLKPVTVKKFPAKWQYYVWIVVALSMIVPVYKMIPEKEVQKISAVSQLVIPQPQNTVTETEQENNVVIPLDTEIKISDTKNLKAIELITYIWLLGVIIFLTVVTISYIVFTVRRHKHSVLLKNYDVLNEVKKQLKIKRGIKLRMSTDTGSPMLVGVLFPAIYIPCKEIPDDMLRLVFIHELTHFKRKDLIIKWFALFVNAVHWFNPLSYLLCANLSEACEVSCDMEVTKNMNDEEQKLYMKTILDLVEVK